MSTVRCKSTRF